MKCRSNYLLAYDSDANYLDTCLWGLYACPGLVNQNTSDKHAVNFILLPAMNAILCLSILWECMIFLCVRVKLNSQIMARTSALTLTQ